MNVAVPIGSELTSVSFSFYDAEEIKKISVKQIVNPVILDNLGHPTKGGLYDSALGPYDRHHICATCQLDHFQCPGHWGHIELPVPCYNPLFFVHMFALLRATCLHCHKFRLGAAEAALYAAKLTLLQHGLILDAHNIDRVRAYFKENKATADDEIADIHEAEAEEEEGIQGYIARLDRYVKDALDRGAKDPTVAETYKHTVINDLRKDVMGSFLKRTLSKRKCENCGAYANPLRKDGFHKLFKMPLPKKQQIHNNAKGFTDDNAIMMRKPTKAEMPIGNGHGRDAVDGKRSVAEDTSDNDTEAEESDSDVEIKENGMDQKANADVDEEGEDDDATAKKKRLNGIVDQEADQSTAGQVYLTPNEVYKHLRLLFEAEPVLTSLMYGGRSPQAKRNKVAKADLFFIKTLPVSPTRFRPASVMGDKAFESPQNELLNNILKTCERIRDINLAHKAATDAERKRVFETLISNFIQLQHDVNSFIDSTKNPMVLKGGQMPPAGIRQALEKKEGLFRKHMMGKRVNYAARSVISPDPNIETSEIGIPPVFAKKLTYPEPVTHYNVKEMMKAVINGPEKWPGASFVQHEDGSMTSLASLSVESRIALANTLLTPQESSGSSSNSYSSRGQVINKKVYRHLRNGDLLLLNRQPTLHKPSIMAHRARVLPGEKTIRMHYANCNTYNADFDGDEMNVHFPQNEIARAEASLIANTDNQYLVPTSGNPLRGLIQDHVVCGVWMTARDTFFTRDEYQQLLYGSLRPEQDGTGGGRILMVPPAIRKPQPLWTGKQVISTVLKNLTVGCTPLNLTSKAKVGGKYWGPDGADEAVVHFMDGELLTGVLDKSQFGASAFGLVHSCYELYGPPVAGMLLSILGRLFTKYAQSRGFTCRMEDLRLTAEGDKWRKELIEQGKTAGPEATIEYLGLKEQTQKFKGNALEHDYKLRMEEVLRNDEKLAGLDNAMKMAMNKLTSSIISKCIPDGLLCKFPQNNMQMMTVSGAKGSPVNVSQISCLLGQQELEGRRVPIMVSGKSLPSFQPFDRSARAGGYIAGRFLTGIRAQEYYFHCMAGREGLIDTAVKTSRSGYLQRCLIKHLEGIRVHYDHSVRDADGSILQFHYGEDSLDVVKQKHLVEFDFSAQNFEALSQKYNPKAAVQALETEKGEEYMKKALRKEKKYDPALSKFSPSRHLGVVSEKFERALRKYVEENPQNLPFTKDVVPTKNSERFAGITKNKFRALMHLKYLYSLVDPGESVGLLAAQSVGEPSTQMTLNTFHFAGFGAKNVTLGIPRLREIVMTASANITTPTMILPLREDVSEEVASRFCKDASKLTLADVMDKVTVTERFLPKSADNDYRRAKVYEIRLDFFSQEEYGEEYNVSAAEIEYVLEHSFIKRLENEVMRDIRKVFRKTKATDDDDIAKPVKQVRQKGTPSEGKETNGDESDDGDGDATAERMASRGAEHATYDAPDEDDEAIMKSIDKALEKEERELEGEGEDEEMDQDEDQKNPDQQTREDRITSSHRFIKSYRFDNENGSWCELELQFPADTQKLLMVDIVERISSKVIVHQIPGVDKVMPYINPTENDKKKRLQTDGCNLSGMWEYADIIDLSQLDTNDIAAVLRTYGVEAARNAIIKEVSGVFGAYGIDVDRRHLSLIADYMTFEGGYKPFNRMGLQSNVSPFLQMSYETTCQFLTQATLHGDYDTLDSPSARIVVGRPVAGGTGSFDVLQPLVQAH